MKRLVTFFLTATLLGFFSIGLSGCDESPNSVEDFPVQGTMDSPSGITVSSTISPVFSVSYQGLEQPPTATLLSSEGDFSIEQDTVTGDPVRGGMTRFKVSLATQQIQEAIRTVNLVLEGTDQNSGRTITDTLSTVATTKLFASTNFTSNFFSFADYEGDVDSTSYEEASGGPDTLLTNTDPFPGTQRQISTSGANYTINNADPPGFEIPSSSTNQPAGSNGVRYMDVANSTPGGTITIRRRMNLPDSDTFFLLVRPADRQTTLTLSFTEVTDGSDGSSGNAATTTHEFSFPLTPGTGWLKLGIPFDEIDPGFNPVAPRSGGNGPLVSLTVSADASVTYGIDEMLFGTLDESEPLPKAEFHDFETTTNAYAPPFCGGTYGFTEDVASGTDGFFARTMTNAGCLGYNYGGGVGPPMMVFLDVDGNDVLSFYGKGVGADRTLSPFLQTNGAGGYGGSVQRTLPQGTWKKFEIRLDQLGSDPSALLENGIRNIGFGGCPNCVVDDIKIVPKP